MLCAGAQLGSAQALQRARVAVAGFIVTGPRCNLPSMPKLLERPEFVSGCYDTGLAAGCAPDPL
ncbi:MAG: hypothetical protein ACRDTH_18820 [Pseudonocardiaceae bacterium]